MSASRLGALIVASSSAPARGGHAETHARVIEDVAQLHLAILRVHQHGDTSREMRAEIGDDELRAILQEERDAVAWLRAPRA